LRNVTVATAGAAAGGALAEAVAAVAGDGITGGWAGAVEAMEAAEAVGFGAGRAAAGEINPRRQAHDTRMASRAERTPLASAKTDETVKWPLRRLDFAIGLDDTARA
jgi:hypothetical protein